MDFYVSLLDKEPDWELDDLSNRVQDLSNHPSFRSDSGCICAVCNDAVRFIPESVQHVTMLQSDLPVAHTHVGGQ